MPLELAEAYKEKFESDMSRLPMLGLLLAVVVKAAVYFASA